MRSLDDARDQRLPSGALLWCAWSVVVAGMAIDAVALASLHHGDVGVLVRRPALWLIAAPIAVTTLRPVIPKGRGGDGTFARVVFLFALLLRIGLPPAVLLCTASLLLRGALSRRPARRTMFSAAQHVVTLALSWLVIRSFGIDPTPRRPWMFHERPFLVHELLAVGLAALAYLVIDNAAAYAVTAFDERRSFLAIAREDLRHLMVVGVALVSLAPLVLVVVATIWPLVPLFYPALFSLYHNASRSQAREHDALHDSLTGLGNREMLHREATRVFDNPRRRDNGVAVLVLDLDGFKSVNDTLGHAAGDHLLQIVAERLRAVMRPGDVVARLGGDEFVAIVNDIPDAAAARIAADRLLRRVNGPCQIDGHSIELRASLGVALAPDHGHEFDSLLRRADRAMYVAKGARCGVAVFDPQLDGDRRRLLLTAGTIGRFDNAVADLT